MGLVNISEGASLALHSMAMIAGGGERITVRQIAQKMDVSQAHLAKVFQRLSKSGLVHSMRGPAGGMVLSKPADEITFLDIYETIEGKVVMKKCPLDKNYCPFEKCIFSDKLNNISNEIYEAFQNIRLSDFI